MKTRLESYLNRIYSTIYSRRDLEVEEFEVFDRSEVPNRTSRLNLRLRFWDDSLLKVEEVLISRERFIVVKELYTYHYQRTDGTLVFRYDNYPHYPKLPNFPHHKHVGDRVEPATPPDLSDVLREIDTFLYASAEEF